MGACCDSASTPSAFRHVDGGDAAGIVFQVTSSNPAFSIMAARPCWLGKVDGARQVHEALAVARDQAAPEGDEVLEVEAVQRAPYAFGGVENSRHTSAPPGLSTRNISESAWSRSGMLRMPYAW